MTYTKKLIQEVTFEGQLQRHYEVNSKELGQFTIVVADGKDADEAIASSLNSTTTPYVETYATQRKAAYPSIEDQFDTLYHGGYDVWKASIRAVKDQFPKP
jgi:hypothetical protein